MSIFNSFLFHAEGCRRANHDCKSLRRSAFRGVGTSLALIKDRGRDRFAGFVQEQKHVWHTQTDIQPLVQTGFSRRMRVCVHHTYW